MVQMLTQGPRQSETLHIAPFSNQIMNLIAVTHMHRGLFDDRAGIELFGDVMGSSADQLDPPLPSAVIGLRPGKGRQKRMVNVDHRAKAAQEITAQHLHVFGQNRQVNPLLSQ